MSMGRQQLTLEWVKIGLMAFGGFFTMLGLAGESYRFKERIKQEETRQVLSNICLAEKSIVMNQFSIFSNHDSRRGSTSFWRNGVGLIGGISVGGIPNDWLSKNSYLAAPWPMLSTQETADINASLLSIISVLDQDQNHLVDENIRTTLRDNCVKLSKQLMYPPRDYTYKDEIKNDFDNIVGDLAKARDSIGKNWSNSLKK